MKITRPELVEDDLDTDSQEETDSDTTDSDEDRDKTIDLAIDPALLRVSAPSSAGTRGKAQKRKSIAQEYLESRASFKAGGGGGALGGGQFTLDTVILDIGSRYSKLGYECEAVPRRIVATKLRLGDWRLSKPESDSAFRDGAKLPPRFVQFSKMTQSQETWNETAAILVDDLLFRQLIIRADHRRVLVVADPFWPQPFKKALAKALFDINVPAIYFLDALYAPLFLTKKTSGLVIDVGYHTTKMQGTVFGHKVKRSSAYTTLGFATALERFTEMLLAKMGIDISKFKVSSEDLESCIARLCVVAPRDKSAFDGAVGGKPLVSAVRWEFSIGKQLSFCKIPSAVRLGAFDSLFETDDSECNIVHFVCDTLLKCPSDSRIHMLSNVVLTGGTVAIRGFVHRFKAEWLEALKLDKYSALRPFEKHLRVFESTLPTNTLNFSGASIFSDVMQHYVDSLFLTKEQWTKSGGSLFKEQLSSQRLIAKYPFETRQLKTAVGGSQSGHLGGGRVPFGRAAGRGSRIAKRMSIGLTTGVSETSNLKERSKKIQDRVMQLKAKAAKRRSFAPAMRSALSSSDSSITRPRFGSSISPGLGSLKDDEEDGDEIDEMK